MNLLKNICDYRAEYDELGFDTLPLIAGTKEPLCRGWPTRKPSEMWGEVREDVNIGIRMGGKVNLAVIDCDDKNQPGTSNNVQKYLTGKGYLPGDYAVVQTASGVGHHYYFSFSGGLEGNKCHLSSTIGVGDFYYGQGAYVVAPISYVAGNTYQLINGDFNRRPTLTLTDIQSILYNKEPILGQNLHNLSHLLLTKEPIKIQHIPKLSRLGQELLRGRLIENYRSRSEADAALMTCMINSGYDYQSIKEMFMRFPCSGKYGELREHSVDKADDWLECTYENVKQFATTHVSKSRQAAIDTLEWAESYPWPGRTGGVDRDVFIAHVLLWHKAGRFTYNASCRDIADLAGVEPSTAVVATKRLISMGYITLETKHPGETANRYQISIDIGHIRTYPSPPPMRVCTNMAHDCFRRRGLGKSGGLIYSTLKISPATIMQLKDRTGRSITTIKRALKRMAFLVDSVTGEVISMVEKDGDLWQALDVDLDQVAWIVGTSGIGKVKLEKHAEERRKHHQVLNPANSSKSDSSDVRPLPCNV